MEIKDRILHIAENKGISKQKFFRDMDLNYGNFKGSAKKSALSTDSLVKILSKYPSVNSDWLLFGKGVMESDDEAAIEPEITQMKSTDRIDLDEIGLTPEDEINLLIAKSKIESLERENLLLRELVSLLKGKL